MLVITGSLADIAGSATEVYKQTNILLRAEFKNSLITYFSIFARDLQHKGG